MKRFLIYCLLLLAFVANADVQYNARFGHFLVNNDCDLYLKFTETDAGSKTDSLSYIAFSRAGSRSSTVPLDFSEPLHLGHFAAGTSLTFWFTSVDPLGTVGNTMAVTNKIKLHDSDKSVPYYTMENHRPDSKICFILDDEVKVAAQASTTTNSIRASNLPLFPPAPRDN